MNKNNIDFVSENGTDLCVICKKDTLIPTDKNILFRDNYIEGVGQLCTDCNKE